MLKVSFIVRKCKKYLKLSTLKEFLFRTLSSPSTLCAKNKRFPGERTAGALAAIFFAGRSNYNI